MRHRSKRTDPLAGAAVGLIAGLGAAFVMEAFQNKVSELRKKAEAAKPDSGAGADSGNEQSEPSTEKAADKLSQVTTGIPLPKAYRPAAGRAVHYATGAAIGMAYGAIAERWKGVTIGYGVVFGTGAAVLLDDGVAPLLGLTAPPQDTPATEHVYSLASHWVYGLTLEVLRGALRRLG